MIDALTRIVPDDLAGISLSIMAFVAFAWGVVAIVSGWRKHRREKHRGIPRTFAFWLGLFLVFYVSGISTILGYVTIRSPHGAPLWFVCYAIINAAMALIAGRLWARERREHDRTNSD